VTHACNIKNVVLILSIAAQKRAQIVQFF